MGVFKEAVCSLHSHSKTSEDGRDLVVRRMPTIAPRLGQAGESEQVDRIIPEKLGVAATCYPPLVGSVSIDRDDVSALLEQENGRHITFPAVASLIDG
jgi:hypothetical protein